MLERCSGRPGLFVLLVSPHASLEVEGTSSVHGNRGMLPSSTSVRFLYYPPSPERAPAQRNNDLGRGDARWT
jgi:hypothetical protein